MERNQSEPAVQLSASFPRCHDLTTILRPSLLLLLLYSTSTSSFAAKRVKVNKYAKFSKADEVRQSLRFSNVEEAATALRDDVAAAPPSAAAATVAAQPQRNRTRNQWTYPDAAEVDQRDPSTFGFTEIGVVLGAHGVRGELKISSDSDFAHARLCTPGITWLRKPRRRAPREVKVLRGRRGPGSNNYLVELDEVGSREAAAALKGATLFVRRELKPELEADEMMLWELEGLRVMRAEKVEDDEKEEAESEAEDDDGSSESRVRWRVGEEVGTIIGVIPREEITGRADLGNDLLEIALAEEEDDDEAAAPPPPPSGPGGALVRRNGKVEVPGPDTVLVPFVPQIVVDVRLSEGLVLIDPPGGLLEIVQPKRLERVMVRGFLSAEAKSLQERREAEESSSGDE